LLACLHTYLLAYLLIYATDPRDYKMFLKRQLSSRGGSKVGLGPRPPFKCLSPCRAPPHKMKFTTLIF